VLLDGFGTDYYEQSLMPTLKAWARQGFFKRIRGVMSSVTNTNVAGLCCGVHADEHGITGNSYWDADAGWEQFMSDGNLLTATTLFQRGARVGVRSALLSAKQNGESSRFSPTRGDAPRALASRAADALARLDNE
jgi:phosphonoacetate hydrolase